MVKIDTYSYRCSNLCEHVKIFFNPRPECACYKELSQEDLTILYLSFDWKLSDDYPVKSIYISHIE